MLLYIKFRRMDNSMKRLIILILLMNIIIMAKNSHKPLKSMLLNSSQSISVNLKELMNDTYKVKVGDDLASISSKYNISIKKIKKFNNLKSVKSLVVGSILKIPDQTIKLETLLANIKNLSSLLKEAEKHLGKSYVWGAVGPTEFDCSGFTSFVCRKNGINIPRTSINQSKVGIKIAREDLKEGDLIFFDTSKDKKGYITHVGLYLGNNNFIHASSANKKVVISSLNQSFYKARFKWGRRVSKR